MYFDNLTWRERADEVINKLNIKWPGLSVISPFGFELTEKKSHLSKILRKFYCYIGIPPNYKDAENAILEVFTEYFLNSIKDNDPKFYKHLVMLIKNKKFIPLKEPSYLCHTYDKLLDIQTRITHDIYEEYANYVICCTTSVLKKIGECKDFDNKVLWRSRTFQLYIMLEYLFGHLIENMTEEDVHFFTQISTYINNSIQIFYTEELMNTLATAKEMNIYNKLIIKRVEKIMNILQDSKDLKEIAINDFHTYSPISVKIDAKKYIEAKQKVITTYKNFV